jgi:hypothetical protein
MNVSFSSYFTFFCGQILTSTVSGLLVALPSSVTNSNVNVTGSLICRGTTKVGRTPRSLANLNFGYLYLSIIQEIAIIMALCSIQINSIINSNNRGSYHRLLDPPEAAAPPHLLDQYGCSQSERQFYPGPRGSESQDDRSRGRHVQPKTAPSR